MLCGTKTGALVQAKRRGKLDYGATGNLWSAAVLSGLNERTPHVRRDFYPRRRIGERPVACYLWLFEFQIWRIGPSAP